MARKKYTVNNLKQYAESKNGTCLSDEYINSCTKYIWKCNKCGNIWENTWGHIYNREQWCPKCAYVGVAKKTENITLMI